ncbi:sporulation protein [Chitiniphilus purpureus]|uniref:Sporulation protein n=1 Tax=Chitiniphilus purpureus TaxID=2981137 RepID=A0ABY6DI33_9NEIS|nr:sporulation protein [Chitiniphilus sp. CD1]UXY14004.1 sporulation protein [Chitiniphilus sp. CD1]
MFKKLLAALGAGGASVDTRLNNPTLAPGEVLSGEVLIQGGEVPQTLEHVELALMTEVEVEHEHGEHYSNHVLGTIRLAGRQEVQPGQQIRLPFQFQLPLETPINDTAVLAAGYVRAPVWIHTDLAIQSAVDASDRDYVTVRPTAPMQRLIQAMSQAGFTLSRVDVERGTARAGNRYSTLGCYQELEFRPSYGSWSIAEVEVTFLPGPHDTLVLLEIDRRLRGDGYITLTMGANWASINWEAELQRVLR